MIEIMKNHPEIRDAILYDANEKVKKKDSTENKFKTGAMAEAFKRVGISIDSDRSSFSRETATDTMLSSANAELSRINDIFTDTFGELKDHTVREGTADKAAAKAIAVYFSAENAASFNYLSR